MHMMPWTRSIGLVVAVGLLLSLASNHAPEQAFASAASLPSVSSGARPGPDVLYAPAPAAPQLENRNPRFNASPLLVSGTEAYVNGEYLYQDYLYDDYGSNTNGSGGTPLSPRAGDINYPTNNARYGGNAAVMSFEPRQVADLRNIAPRLARGMAVRTHTWRDVFAAPKQAIAALAPTLASRPQFLAYSVRDLPALLPTLTHNLLAMPLLAWTVRNPLQREKARRYADQIIFEGFRP